MQELLQRPDTRKAEHANRYLNEVLLLLGEQEFDAAERYMNTLYHMYEPETRFERDYIPSGVEEGLEEINTSSSLFQEWFPGHNRRLERIERLSGEMLEYYTRPIYWKEAGNGEEEIETFEPLH